MKKYIITFIIAIIIFFIVLNLPVSAKTYTTTVPFIQQSSSRSKSVSLGNQLKIRLLCEDYVLYNQNAAFYSSNTAIATVNKRGIITPKQPGKTSIIITYKNKTAKINLTVKNSSTFSLRTQIVNYAISFVGKLPYVYGGDSLITGTDCSGFVHLIYEHFGISVPRIAASFQTMSNITREQLQPGDLVAYRNGGHVAMYIGNGQVVHAKGSKYGTVIDNIDYGTPTGYVRIIAGTS